MTTVNANGVALGVESFGAHDAPLVLLAGATTMLSWPDALCERLAAGGRRVVRYDLRDSGESTTADPEAPAYTLRDLAADAAALTDALGGGVMGTEKRAGSQDGLVGVVRGKTKRPFKAARYPLKRRRPCLKCS
jgi:predicted alpha/beta hydrolase